MKTIHLAWCLLPAWASTSIAISTDADNTSIPSGLEPTTSRPNPLSVPLLPPLCSSSRFDPGLCHKASARDRQLHCGPLHKNRKCSPGDCCSANGKCGRTESFCGTHCQPEFGDCHTKIEKIKTSIAPNLIPRQDPPRCGKDFGQAKCDNGNCCSISGFCGQGKDFCSVPKQCQRGFGVCDSDTVPKGPELSPILQRRPQLGKIPYGEVITKCTIPKTAALSFEGGPHKNTNAILDLLKDHNTRATFFLSGVTDSKGMIDESSNWIEVVKRIIMDGHQIGSHTWSEPSLDNLSRDERWTEMVKNDRAIANIVGKFPTYMRPPYVECSRESGCLQDMADLGYHVVGLDVDSHDWEKTKTLDEMKGLVDGIFDQRKADNNIFFVQHDDDEYVIEVTKHLLEQVKKKTWKAVTFGECVEDPEEFWYIKPFLIDLASIAHAGGSYGCVTSASGFCGRLLPFHDVTSYRASVLECNLSDLMCEAWHVADLATCSEYSQICDQLYKYEKGCMVIEEGLCDQLSDLEDSCVGIEEGFCDQLSKLADKCAEAEKGLCNSDTWYPQRFSTIRDRAFIEQDVGS